MASEWREVTIRDIAAPARNALVGGPFGSNLVSSDYVDAGVPVIRGQNMGGRWVSGDFAFVTEGKAESLNANLARPGDIVFTQRGTLGQVSLVPEMPFERYLVSQSQMKLTVNRDLADPLFFFYVFSTTEQQDYIRQNAIQTGVPHTNLGILRETPVFLPPLAEQRAIAHILGTLDDKIELNRRMNETLEAMARALFKSWFVDATEVGIPEGWREGKVEELASLSRETINPMEFPGETFDHYSIPAFDEGRLSKAEKGDQIRSNKFIVPPNAVMISKLNPRILRVWLPNISTSRRSVASTEFLVAIPRVGVSREYLFGLFNSMAFLEVFATMVTGTSGSHQRVKPEYLLAMEVAIASSDTIEKYTEHTKLLHERVTLNLEESHTLAALRDALLPKLISGKLLAPDLAYISGSHKP